MQPAALQHGPELLVAIPETRDQLQNAYVNVGQSRISKRNLELCMPSGIGFLLYTRDEDRLDANLPVGFSSALKLGTLQNHVELTVGGWVLCAGTIVYPWGSGCSP